MLIAIRRMLGLAAGAALLACAGATWAQVYPSRPITLVVPYAAGGGTDILARVVGKAMGDVLGRQVVIDNKPGGSTMIGANFVAKSAPDGYTLLMGASTFVIQESLPVKEQNATLKDFEPIGVVASTPMLLAVHPGVPSGSLKQFIDHARANPGKLNYATFGKGSTTHLVTEFMNAELGLRMTDVPYKGAAPAITDLIRGEIQVFCDLTVTALPLAKDGRAKVIAIMSERRSEQAPEIPTFAELGFPNVKAGVVFGVLAPAGTPRAIVEQLNAALATVLKTAEVSERIRGMASTAGGGSPAQFAEVLTQERDKWKKLIDRIGLKLE